MKAHMKLGKSKKLCGILLLCCGIIAAIVMILRTVYKKETIEKDIVKYEYQINKNINYKIFLKDNIIYDEDFLEEGLYYPRKLIEFIRLKYDFEYTGSDVVPIKIDYRCLAKISAYNVQNNVRETYWTKSFPLNDWQSLEKDDYMLKVEEEIDTGLEDYFTFIEDASKELGINLLYNISFCMEGTVCAKTPYGEVNQPINFDITSVLSNVMNFSKNSMDSTSGNISEKQVELLPINKTMLYVYILLAVALLLAVMYILIFTRDYELNDLVLLSVKKIQREYGSRMVSLNSNTAKSFSRIYDVQSIKDLVKVSDEIQKPILYEKDDKELVKDFKFFVQNGEELYEYCVLNSFVHNFN